MSDTGLLEKRDPVADGVFRLLLDLYMVSDPWPLEPDQDQKMQVFLLAEASKRGYDSWVTAYHEFDPADSDTSEEA
jgi:hypothetical protein